MKDGKKHEIFLFIIVTTDGDERRLTGNFFCCKLFPTLLKRGGLYEKEA